MQTTLPPRQVVAQEGFHLASQIYAMPRTHNAQLHAGGRDQADAVCAAPPARHCALRDRAVARARHGQPGGGRCHCRRRWSLLRCGLGARGCTRCRAGAPGAGGLSRGTLSLYAQLDRRYIAGGDFGVDAPVVLDHMGRVDAKRGADDADFAALLTLLKNPKFHVKVSGIDRIDAFGSRKLPPYTQGIALARFSLAQLLCY